MDIFLSYSANDRELALVVVQALKAQGWNVFFDRTIPAGAKWQDVLRKQLSAVKCVVVLLTRNSIKSSWVHFEASIAFQHQILVPLLLDTELNLVTDLPEMYRDIHVVQLLPDPDTICSASHNELWIRAIRDILKQSKTKTIIKNTAKLATLAFILISAAYMLLSYHNTMTLWRAGVRYAEYATYSKEENERLKEAIRNATLIELLVTNANSFMFQFKDDLAVFLKKGGGVMHVNFANPDTEFYDAAMVMTNPGFIKGDARESDRNRPANSRQIILDLANSTTSKLQFRQFNTEYRLPVILIDRKYCFLAARLTPDQSIKSLRLEPTDESAGTATQQFMAHATREIAYFLSPSTERESYIESCKRHFDAVWNRSKDVILE